MMSDLAPIVLFVYNRPDHTRRTLAALSANPLAAGSDLLVYADGPKKPEHEASVSETRQVVREVTGFKSLRVIERDQNLGLANSIMSGVADVCATYGRVIVVEDDLVVSPDFLQWLNAGLDRYRDEARVLQVSGYSYPAHDRSASDAFFLPMISCWGWATWARAWAYFDPHMAAMEQLDRDPQARRCFNIDDTYDYYGMACSQRDGKLDSWGVRWQLSLFARDGLVLYPRDTLVYNAGVDASGTHGAGHAAFQRELGSNAMQIDKVTWPDNVATDELAMTQVKRLLRANKPGLVRRIIGRIRA